MFFLVSRFAAAGIFVSWLLAAAVHKARARSVWAKRINLIQALFK